MKIEDFVSDILATFKNLYDEETDILIDRKIDQLNRLCIHEKYKYRVDYRKVSQALGEVGIDVILQRAVGSECCDRRLQGLRLLVHCMTNTAVIRRVLSCGSILYGSLHTVFHGFERNKVVGMFCEDIRCVLEILHRCMLVGQGEDRQEFCRLGIISDLFCMMEEAVSKVRLYPLNLEILTLTYQIFALVLEEKGPHLRELYVCEKSQSHVSGRLLQRIQSENVVADEYRLQKERFITVAKRYVHLIRNESIDSDSSILKLSRSQRLASGMGEEYMVFCSSPECRKQELTDKMLKHCGQCMLARYCSPECQRFHWKNGHRKCCVGKLNKAKLTVW